MKKFSYEGLASIQNLNTRKQGPEDDKELAVDIKFLAQTNALICECFDDLLDNFLFLSSGAVRNEQQEPVSYKHELMHYRLQAPGMSFSGVTVKKMTLEPKDGFKINITFQVSFKPLSLEIAKLAEFLQEAIVIRIEPENEELAL